MNFDHILNWKLLKGSHEFPGSDGGTCLNEAAIVAAGFEYRSVSSPADCPSCFSPVLSAYAIALNDGLPDDLRQSLLLPFVTRLAGTRGSDEIERQRLDFIVLGCIRTLLPIALRNWRNDLAAECALVADYDQAIVVVNKIRYIARVPTRNIARNIARDIARDLTGTIDLDHAFDLVFTSDIDFARDHILALVLAITVAAGVDRALPSASYFDRALALAHAHARARAIALTRAIDLAYTHVAHASPIAVAIAIASVALLDGAMKIGKRAPEIELNVVTQRMAAAKRESAVS